MPLFFDPIHLVLAFGGILIYWRLPVRWRAMGLVVLSTGLISRLYPEFAITLILLSTLFYYSQTIMPARGARKWRLGVGIGGAVSLIFIYKGLHSPWMVGGGSRFQWVGTIGASFFAFRLIQVAADRYRGLIPELAFRDLIGFLTFFPTMGAGPLQKFQDFTKQRSAPFEPVFFHQGVYRLGVGYFKKIVIADFLLKTLAMERLRSFFWFPSAFPLDFGFVQFLYAYCDLSAYTDLAIGFSLFLGYRVGENFRFPLMATSLPDFWRRWHLSLSAFCRDQIYFPLLVQYRKPFLALLASMLVMGLWHHISFGWASWGLWHGLGLYLSSRWGAPLVRRWNKGSSSVVSSALVWGGRVLTLAFVAVGYTLVTLDFPLHLNLPKVENTLVLKLFHESTYARREGP